MNIGIIGCGFIGNEIAKFLDNDKQYGLIALNDTNKANAMSLLESLKNNSPKLMKLGDLINQCDLIKIKNCRIFLPSGAIAGLDAIKSVSGRIKSLMLTTTKPINSLENAPFVVKNKINLKNIPNKKIIFEGEPADAVEGFPQNINVAATLFLASKFDGIKIRIIADPNAKLNTHQVQTVGDFGSAMILI